MSFIYLASPYTHDDPAVVDDRWRAAERFVAHWVQKQFCLYSPICHFHPLASMYEFPTGFEFWQRQNAAMLCKASELWVLTLPQWEASEGVDWEMRFAKQCAIPVKLKQPV